MAELMARTQRIWRLYADPAQSAAAANLKALIPLDTAAFIYRMAAPHDWPTLSGTTLWQLGMWWALLVFVRQRDEARTEHKAAREQVGCRRTP